MVTTTEVEWAYRMLLGREPESEVVVEGFAKGVRTLDELRRGFLSSPEFLLKFERQRMAALTAGEAPTLPMAVPERKVQTQVSEDELDRLLGRIEKEFVY